MLLLLAGLGCSDPPPAAPLDPPPAATPAPSSAVAPTGADPGGEAAPRGIIGGEPILPKTVVIGAVATKDVDAAMATQRAAFRACYDNAPAQEGGKGAGKVLLRFSIAGNGRAFGVTTRSTSLRNPAVEACLHQTLDAVQFPLIDVGTAVVMYPFSFP